MKYYVTYAINGRYVVEVDANSINEARDKADDIFRDVNLNEMDYIESEDIIVEDEHDIVWER